MALRPASKEATDLIRFLHTMGRLKDTPRTGWVDNGVPNPESISDHMYRMSLMCMMCPDNTLDREKMIKMALCHDTGESIIGDISPQMNVPSEVKAAKELEAVESLSALASSVPGTEAFGKELLDLFREYEAQETRESHFVKDMDLLEMVVQAHGYEGLNPGKDLGGFFKSGEKIKHPWARAIYKTLCETRPALAPRKAGPAGEQVEAETASGANPMKRE